MTEQKIAIFDQKHLYLFFQEKYTDLAREWTRKYAM